MIPSIGSSSIRGSWFPPFPPVHAWMSANATVLTAHQQVRRERILVAEGDTLIPRGTGYTISKDRYGRITLTPATAAVST